MHKAVTLVDCHNRLGEGPFWDARVQTLFWVDIDAAQIHHYHPGSNLHGYTQVESAVTALGARARGGLIAAVRHGIVYFDPAAESLTPLLTLLPDSTEIRFNDGAVDPLGRFWAGTYSQKHEPVSQLFCVNHDLSVELIQSGLINSNGLGWSPDKRTMYHTHTTENTIFAYDFDPATGEVDNRRPFIEVPDQPGEGRPDGLAVDSDGFLWSAHWDGSKIVRYDPSGKIERTVSVPTPNVTSCVFGGPERNLLYITSARGDAPVTGPEDVAGNLFVLQVDVKGQRSSEFLG